MSIANAVTSADVAKYFDGEKKKGYFETLKGYFSGLKTDGKERAAPRTNYTTVEDLHGSKYKYQAPEQSPANASGNQYAANTATAGGALEKMTKYSNAAGAMANTAIKSAAQKLHSAIMISKSQAMRTYKRIPISDARRAAVSSIVSTKPKQPERVALNLYRKGNLLGDDD
ncbi:hypothetical protein ACFL0W_03585 [Nanoarchaeota archaeon]